MNKDYDRLIPNFQMGEGIPKLIHQTYKTKNIDHAELRDNISSIQALNPQWKYHLWNDREIEDFIQRNYGSAVYNYYQRISPCYGAARADFFRYLLIYKCGGVYLDLKSYLTKPLDSVLLPDDKYLLAHWDNMPRARYADYGRHQELDKILPRGEFQQWFIVSVPGHPFLREVIKRVMKQIDSYRPWREGIGFDGVLRTTGPIPYTEAIYSQLQEDTVRGLYRQVDRIEDLGFEYSIYDRSGASTRHKGVVGPYYRNRSSVIVFSNRLVMALIEICFTLIWKLRAVLDSYRRMKATNQ